VLWAAPLVKALSAVPGTTPLMYADDTAALCAGRHIDIAKQRAQQAADALVGWARRSKMQVAGEKTQLLVLSHYYPDSVGCEVKVAGKTVAGGSTLTLLGVTLDRLLHFGDHCRKLRGRSRPRIAQLRQLTGRSWGLQEQNLRTVANGYIRGSLEHAAAAWLPATPPSHVEILEQEMRAAARVITGCVKATRCHALMAEAGLAPVAARRTALAARFLAKAHALPEDDPLRVVAEAEVTHRQVTVTGWRRVGQEMWRVLGVTPPIEPLLPPRVPPWTSGAGVTFDLTVGPLPLHASDQQKKEAATLHLNGLPQCATWVWSDGSADAGVANGGAGALIEWPDGEHHELRAPAGKLCSSYRAELVALRTALTYLREHPAHTEDPIVVCTDSQSALATLRAGPSAQTEPLAIAVWEALATLATDTRRVHLQWVPSHCDLAGNEAADRLAKEATSLPQEEVPVDVRTVYRAAVRAARAHSISKWLPGWYRTLMGDRLPPPVTLVDRSMAVDVHQLRAGHWSGSTRYLHWIGRKPCRECPKCDDYECVGARCPFCREEADTSRHTLLRCSALMKARHDALGTIHPRPEEVRSSSVVAAMGAASRYLQSLMATPGLRPAGGI